MHTMAHFRCELFEDPIQYEETPLRDRKENLPCIVGQEHRDEKVEFLKEIIHREEFLAPTGWIPISFPLRNRERDVQDVERLVGSYTNQAITSGRFRTLSLKPSLRHGGYAVS